MILTQLLMIKRHVLTLEKLQAVERDTIEASIVFKNLYSQYLKAFQDALSPTSIVLLFILIGIPLYVGWKKSAVKEKEWLLLAITGPLWLLTIQYRNSDHMLIGVDSILYLVLSVGLFKISKDFFKGKILFSFFIGIFIISNLLALHHWKTDRIQYYGIQKGALLSEQLQLIDKTYELAEGKEFSISSATNPYAMNITWSYLYDWYGRSKYGYVPQYYGMSQIGMYGEGLLPETYETAANHFTIIEPDTGIPSRIMTEFLLDQDSKSSTPSGNLEFGTLNLQLRNTLPKTTL